jgi:hypothetical protein
MMPVPDPSPDAGRRRDRKRPGRCLFRVTIGRAVSVLVSAATAIFRAATVWRSVIAPEFETAVSIVPTALRRRCGNTANQQQGGAYKFRAQLHRTHSRPPFGFQRPQSSSTSRMIWREAAVVHTRNNRPCTCAVVRCGPRAASEPLAVLPNPIFSDANSPPRRQGG